MYKFDKTIEMYTRSSVFLKKKKKYTLSYVQTWMWYIFTYNNWFRILLMEYTWVITSNTDILLNFMLASHIIRYRIKYKFVLNYLLNFTLTKWRKIKTQTKGGERENFQLYHVNWSFFSIINIKLFSTFLQNNR